jgi:hypothetical protein
VEREVTNGSYDSRLLLSGAEVARIGKNRKGPTGRCEKERERESAPYVTWHPQYDELQLGHWAVVLSGSFSAYSCWRCPYPYRRMPVSANENRR